jgi:hypothetical protein
MILLPLAAVFALWITAVQANQTLTNQTPSDARSNQFEEAKGTSWRVFAVDSHPAGPIAVTQVEEVRQHNPPSLWAVSIRNRAPLPVASLTMAAAVVDVNGAIKAVQPMPVIKNLKPGQVQRRETRIRVTVLAPTDRVVFFLKELTGETGDWKAADGEVAALIKDGARRLPVP